jgi:hypothetical protein
MIDTEIIHPDTYSTLEMVRDLRTGIFSEANYIKNVAIFRRNLQKSLIARLAMLLNSKEGKNSDISSIIRGEFQALYFQLTIAQNRRINRITKYHYRDCLAEIKNILNPK